MKIGIAVLALLPALAILAARADENDSVLTYHGSPSRSGHFVVPGLTREKAGSLRPDPAFVARLAGPLYAQPLYWHPANSDKGVLFAVTENNVVEAIDAADGKEIWRRTVGDPVRHGSLPCGNISPLGITGTPVIDPKSQAIYFDAAIWANGPHHKVFGLSLKDGAILPGWPIDVGDALKRSGHGFDPRVQNQRAALTILDGNVYVAFGGHFGDCGDYHGFVVGIALENPGNIVAFETRARGGGIWSPGGLSIVDHNLFFATGNTMDAQSWGDGEAVFRLGADLRRTDGSGGYYFTPADWKRLDAHDADLGGSNPLPLNLSAGGRSQSLILALGKDGKAYLADQKNLGGVGGQLTSEIVSDDSIVTSPSAFPVGDDVFVALSARGSHCSGRREDNELTVLKIAAGSPPTITTAWCGLLRGLGSPIVTTTDGHSDPIVWTLGAEGDNRLHGFRGDTGEPVATSEPLAGLRHFQTLIATRDHLYVGADGRIYAFIF